MIKIKMMKNLMNILAIVVMLDAVLLWDDAEELCNVGFKSKTGV